MREVREISIEQIHPNRHQPRLEFNEDALMELAQSIRENGLIQPITVREDEDGYEIIKCVNNPWIGLVYDIYHMQIMEGNIISNITRNIELTGHIHTAGCPGRHEHFLGENDYPNILAAIARTSYTGFIGLEYFPSYDSQNLLLMYFAI